MDTQTLLSNLQPLIIVVMIILMLGIENIWPYLPKPANSKKHNLRNLPLVLLSLVVNGLAGVGVVMVLQFVEEKQIGLLNWLPLNDTVKIVTGVFLIDFGSYCGHILAHKVPLLWRSHRVHHSDLNLTSTSTLLFHPFDVLYSQLIWFSIVYIAFGISMWSFLIYGTLFLPLFICQHANVKFPGWFEKYARYIISTPGWHKIHHAADQKHTDSHYGDFFTIWDRLFGTWEPVEPDQIEYGLHEFKEPKYQTIGYLLAAPFKNIKRK